MREWTEDKLFFCFGVTYFDGSIMIRRVYYFLVDFKDVICNN